jgi:uncharacterized membrane protein
LDFVLWVCRSMHVFAVVVWLGGLMFQNAILQPVAQHEGEPAKGLLRKVHKRFIGFIWMSVWTLLVTGVILMLASPRFLWFQYHDSWSVLLACKQAVFVLMVIYAYGHARMLAYLEAPSSNGGFNDRAELYRHRVGQFRTMSIALGIIGLLLSAGMQHG